MTKSKEPAKGSKGNAIELDKSDSDYPIIRKLAGLCASRQALTWLECGDSGQAERVLEKTSKLFDFADSPFPYIGWHPLQGFYSADAQVLQALCGSKNPADIRTPYDALNQIFGPTIPERGRSKLRPPPTPPAVYGLFECRTAIRSDTFEGNRAVSRIVLANKLDQISHVDTFGNFNYKFVVLHSDEGPMPKISPELLDLTAFVHVPRPGIKELKKIILDWAQNQDEVDLDDDRLARLAAVCRGLTNKQALDVLSRCIATEGLWDDQNLVEEQIEMAKVASISARSESLNYKPRSAIRPAEELCGFDRAQHATAEIRLAMSEEGQKARLDGSRGFAFIGPPGTGKSMGGEIVSSLLEAPLLVVDVGALLGSKIGETEKAVRTVLRQAVDMGRCVLMLDEIDKALGAAFASQGDGGITARILGAFLMFLGRSRLRKDESDTLNKAIPQYLQDSYLFSSADVFVVMTMNRMSGLPPELFRPGRMDQVFFTELPDEMTRLQLLRSSFKRRGDPWRPTEEQEIALARETAEWTGAEIDSAVSQARSRAFFLTKNPSPPYDVLMDSIKERNLRGCDFRQHRESYTAMLDEARKIGVPVGWKEGDIRPEQQRNRVRKTH